MLNLRNKKILQRLVFILAFIPVLIIGVLILKNGVNLPFWDQWEVVTALENFYRGKLSLSILISQQNESRLLFPKLIFVYLAHFTKWDVRYEMLITFLLACLISFNVYRLNYLTISENRLKGLFLFFISNLLIFAPIQYENWIWGIQLIVFVPIACITTCIVVAYSRLNLASKFFICVFLATVSTFSYANGIIAWVVVFPVLALSGTWNWRQLGKRKLLLFGWLACFIFNIVVYFHNYQKPVHHPSFMYAVQHPFQSLNYFLSFLGSPLGFGSQQGDVFLAAVVGAILILLFVFSNIYLLVWAKSSFVYKTLGWQVIGAYTIISGLITTLGRVGFGVEQSLASRYTTFSIYVCISVIYLVTIAIEHLNNRSNLMKQKLWIKRSSAVLLIIFFLMHLSTSALSIQYMNYLRQERLSAKACLLLMNWGQEDCLTTKVYPLAEELKRRAIFIDNLGLLKPSLVKSSRVKDIAGAVQSNYEYGSFDIIKQVDKNLYMASGWAILPDRAEPADAVILTYENAQGESIIFTSTEVGIYPEDIAKMFKEGSDAEPGWQTTFSLEGITEKMIKLNAWAFNAKTGKAFKVNGSHLIQKST